MEIFIQPTNDSITSTDDKEVASPDFENGFTDTGMNVYSFYLSICFEKIYLLLIKLK